MASAPKKILRLTIAYHLGFGALATAVPAWLGAGVCFPLAGYFIYAFAVNAAWVTWFGVCSLVVAAKSGVFRAMFQHVFRRKRDAEGLVDSSLLSDEAGDRLVARSAWPVLIFPGLILILAGGIWALSDRKDPKILVLGSVYGFGGIAGFVLARRNLIQPISMEFGA